MLKRLLFKVSEANSKAVWWAIWVTLTHAQHTTTSTLIRYTWHKTFSVCSRIICYNRNWRLCIERIEPLLFWWKIFNRAVSSVGRASRLHREGQRFESFTAHQEYGGVAQLVRAIACHAIGRGFESLHSRH